MRIAVVGCGAMGSVYAARLAAAGNEVLVIDRGIAHVEAMNRDGLILAGPDGEIRAPVRALTSPEAVPQDLVILAVKAADAAGAAQAVSPMLSADTVVLTIQNGLGSAELVAEVVGAERLGVGIASGFGASVTGPGRAHHNAMRAVRMGAFGRLPVERLGMVAAAFSGAGFEAEVADDILAMQWEKLICNVAYSAPCALTGRTVGEVMADDHLRTVSETAAIEAWETARALGVGLSVDDPVRLVREFAAPMPAAKPSALLDVEAGRVSEIGFINGAVPREAAKVGRKAPVNETLTALVRGLESRFTARGADRIRDDGSTTGKDGDR